MSHLADWVAERALLLIPLLMSLSVHEWAHAWMANRLGDDTARRLGRLTLDPTRHVDPLGTLLPPLLGIPFGWARPVPVEPTRFRRDVSMARGLVLVAVAGPIANLVLAGISGGFLLAAAATGHELPGAVSRLGWTLLGLNLALAFFNLLPIPPLDGSRVAEGLMPRRLRPAWDAFAAMGPAILLGVLVALSLLDLFG